MKVCFVTFGCRLNRAEALDEESRYLDAGWEVTTDHDKADLFVVRGCSVTARAAHDCEKEIEGLARHHPSAMLRVEGCLAKKNYPGRPLPPKLLPAEKPDVPVPTRTSRAYLKVQDGCSGICTYCIVPTFRGKPRSVAYEDCLARAARFLEAGYHEIVVTGCNLSLYASNGKGIADLLEGLAELGKDSNCRVRLGSLEPSSAAYAVLDVMTQRENVCNFIHLPIQSASNRILASMRRPYLAHDIEDFVHCAVHALPRLSLGCDLISGYPGETETDHLQTYGFLERLPFVNVHAFPYSERPGTLAAGFPGTVPKSVRSMRAREFAKIIDAKRRQFAHRFESHEVRVVIEDAAKCAGWTDEYLWCEAVLPPTHAKLAKKEVVTVRVTHAHDGRLKGVVV